MKKIYVVLLLFIAFYHHANAQATIINDNHSLGGYPIFNGAIFLVSDVDSTLWTSDGTSGTGTKQYAFNVKIDQDLGNGILNNKIYFAGVDATHGTELWVTDGTQAGTKLVQDFIAGTKSSAPADFIQYKGDLYFTDSSSSGREIYKLSGTNGTISILKDINPGIPGAFDRNSADFQISNGLLYFVADNGTSGKELWVSNGTSSGTKLLKDISVGNASTSFFQFITFGNQLIFTVVTATYSMDLWKTDGTNTSLIHSFNVPSFAYGAFGLMVFNKKIYFAGTDVAHGTELWSTDGNSASMVADIFPGSSSGIPNSSTPQLFNSVFIKGKFLFKATADKGIELWSSDGTAANTQMIKDINPGADGSNPELFPVINYSRVLEGSGIFDFYDRGTLLNGSIFFTADDGTNGKQLWKTDGTLAGTKLVQAIGGPNYGVGDDYFYTKTGLYFTANDGAHGAEPWFTNGTTANMVQDINPGAGSSDPDFEFVFNSKLFGTADNGNGASSDILDLYRIDATASPLPVQLMDFKAMLQPNAVQLTWKTATEINSRDFGIQRSTDGLNFSDIGTVAASVNSTTEKSYGFNDNQYLEAGSNLLYYRLQLNDLDGNIKYSNVLTVKLDAPTLSLKTYPNPVHTQLSILFGTASSKTATLKISDLKGHELYRQDFGKIEAIRLQNINVSGLAKGTYLIQLITEKGSSLAKFVKQ
jgi:ELWxxDGT repeat protein